MEIGTCIQQIDNRIWTARQSDGQTWRQAGRTRGECFDLVIYSWSAHRGELRFKARWSVCSVCIQTHTINKHLLSVAYIQYSKLCSLSCCVSTSLHSKRQLPSEQNLHLSYKQGKMGFQRRNEQIWWAFLFKVFKSAVCCINPFRGSLVTRIPQLNKSSIFLHIAELNWIELTCYFLRELAVFGMY